MSEAVELVRCVGCGNDIATAMGTAACPHCARPIADSLRRWERFVVRDEATVRGALLTIAIAGCLTIPFSLATTVVGGFIDTAAIQRHPMEAMMSSKAPLMMIPACLMLPVQFVMVIAWLLILFFAFGGVLYRVIWPLATAVCGYLAVMLASMVVGVVVAVASGGNADRSQAVSGTLATVNGGASVLLLYITIAWALDALYRSFVPRVPQRVLLWSLAIAAAASTVGSLAHAAIDQRPAFDSALGIARVLVVGVVYTLFTLVVVRSCLNLRRLAAELAERHRGIRVGNQPVVVSADAPPMWSPPSS